MDTLAKNRLLSVMMESEAKVARRVEVVAAVIESDGRILCARRGPGRAFEGKWEFPGGKVEPGESPEDALARELSEELGVEARPLGSIMVVEHGYPALSVTLRVYRAALVSGTPRPLEHAELRWLAPEDLATLDWLEADRPVVQALSSPARRE